MIGRVSFFYILGFPSSVIPRRHSLARGRAVLDRPPCFSGEADRGVSTVAFKLTKSNISQIRLWLFLREPERRVMDRGGGGGLTGKDEDLKAEGEGERGAR